MSGTSLLPRTDRGVKRTLSRFFRDSSAILTVGFLWTIDIETIESNRFTPDFARNGPVDDQALRFGLLAEVAGRIVPKKTIVGMICG